MAFTFLTVIVGYLAGLGKGMALNLASAEVYGRLKQEDLVKLLERCIAEALENQPHGLTSSAALSRGSVPRASLDKQKLQKYLREDKPIAPMQSETDTEHPWREYLEPFEEIIVVSDFKASRAERLDSIQRVLDEASALFRERVPYQQPAFQQLLLKYHEKHSDEHQEIIKKIDSLVPKGTATLVNELQNVNSVSQTQEEVWVNPFSIVAADDLELVNPDHVRQIRSLFISRYTDLPTIEKHYNTILEGQRGTGKTMIMKYLAFETQILEWTQERYRPSTEFLTSPENFIGVYSKLGQGVFDKTDFEAISDNSRRERIFEHRLTLLLLSDTLETMKAVFQHFPPSSESLKRIKQALNSLLETNGTIDACLTANDLIRATQDHISFVSIHEVDKYLGSVSPGGGNASEFNPSLTLSGQLIPFLKLLRECCGTNVPFFLMLDDFDVLEPFQQERVFKTASSRQLSVVCFKFGIMIHGKKVLLSGEGRTFRNSDDFNRIDLDWTQGGLHEDYQKALIDIANARLTAASLRNPGWRSDLPALLPDWRKGNEIYKEIRVEMETEWDKATEKPTDSKSDYVSKYGSARFFQSLRKKKIRMRYAGLDYITMVSSGVYRQFLEICKLIFDRAHDEGWMASDGGVRSEVQDAAVREYSEEMIQQFSRTSGDAQALLRGNIEVTSSHMITLIDSLCDVFYSRLHTPAGISGSGEPEIICVAVRGDLNGCLEADTLLKIAVRESILHRFQYAPKSAGGPDLPAFMLNRRLGPRRDLSIRRMQGRIEVEPEDIVLAANDRKEFFKKMQGKKVDPDADEPPDNSLQNALPLS